MDGYFSNQTNHDPFSRSNQVRNRGNQQLQLNFDHEPGYNRPSHDFRNIREVTGIHGHGATAGGNATDGNFSQGRSLDGRNFLHSKLPIPNLNVKMNRLKTAGKACVDSLRKKIGSIVQQNEPQNITQTAISAKEVSDAMSSGPIRSHREFAMLTENLLAWGGGTYLAQFGSIKDFAELTPVAFYENQIINQHIAIRLVDYMAELAECKRFTVKYINWKLKFSKIPEEYILAVEYLGFCLKNIGAGFPTFITRSLMRSLAKLLKITTFKYSLARDVKKQLTKIISGSSGHQGVATDPRIHALKSKILFTIQLCHDAFIMQQALYPDFFIEYKRMRAKGIKFPRIPPGSRYMIKDVELITSSSELNLPIDMNILAEINQIVTRISNGENNEELRSGLTMSKGKILESINILSDMTLQQFNDITFVKEEKLNYENFMDKLFKLNDAIDELISSNLDGQDLLQFDSNDEEDEEEMDKDLAEIFAMTNDMYEPVDVDSPAINEYSSSILTNDESWSTARYDTDGFNDRESIQYSSNIPNNLDKPNNFAKNEIGYANAFERVKENSINDSFTKEDPFDEKNLQVRSVEEKDLHVRGVDEKNLQVRGVEEKATKEEKQLTREASHEKKPTHRMNMEEIMRTLDQIHSEL